MDDDCTISDIPTDWRSAGSRIFPLLWMLRDNPQTDALVHVVPKDTPAREVKEFLIENNIKPKRMFKRYRYHAGVFETEREFIGLAVQIDDITQMMLFKLRF